MIRLIEKTDGGAFASICGSDWLSSLGWPSPPRPFGNCFFLGGQPVDLNEDGEISEEADEVRVLVDGVVVPSTDGDERFWHYSGELIAICFARAHLPAPATPVVVEYREACRPR